MVEIVCRTSGRVAHKSTGRVASPDEVLAGSPKGVLAGSPEVELVGSLDGALAESAKTTFLALYCLVVMRWIKTISIKEM